MLTTEMQKAVPYKRRDTPCHGGKGLWNARSLTGLMTETALIRFIHDDVLPPGSSIGDHTHAASENGELFEEWYLCLSGRGMMILDGREVPFEEGDINVCRGGGSHGVYNNSDEDLRILVICAKGRNA